MNILSLGPLRATSLLWQERGQRYQRAVIVRVTYDLAPNESPLAAEQDAPFEEDNHWDDDLARSLSGASDLVPAKKGADVVLVGSAYAAVPTRSLVLRLIVGELDKSIEVFADRYFRQDGALYDTASFTRMRLVYERARWGPGTSNPVGVRPDLRDAYGRLPLPNLQPPGLHITTPDDAIDPIGFGPLAPTWQSRMDRLGRSPLPRPERSKPLILNEGFDLGFFNVAPRDQQIGSLHDNERIVIENMHPTHTRLVTSLPSVRPAVFVEKRRGPETVTMRPDTLWIDTDRGVCSLTFRGQVTIEMPDDDGRVVVAMERCAERLTWAEVERQIPGRRRPPARPTLTMVQSPLDDPTTTGPASHAPSTLPFLPTDLSKVARPAEPRDDGALPFQSKNALSQSSASWGRSVPVTPMQAPQPPQAPPAPVASPIPAVPSVSSPPASIGFVAPLGGDPTAAPVIPLARPKVPAPAPAVAPPPPADARSLGLLSASNAAADPWARKDASSEAFSEPTSPAGRDGLDLLWLDDGLSGRLRRVQAWKPLLDALDERPADRDLEGPPEGEAAAAEDQREAFEVLANGEAGHAEALDRALSGLVRKDGKVSPKLILLSGEVAFPFDELMRLRALTAAASPFAGSDELLKATLEDAKSYSMTPAESASASIADALSARLRESFAASPRAVPGTYIDEEADRALLLNRHYQKRKLFGGPQIRCLVTLPGDNDPVPAYLPSDLAEKLPLYQRFRARLVAEVYPVVDQYETHPAALRILALARSTFVGKRA